MYTLYSIINDLLRERNHCAVSVRINHIPQTSQLTYVQSPKLGIKPDNRNPVASEVVPHHPRSLFEI